MIKFRGRFAKVMPMETRIYVMEKLASGEAPCLPPHQLTMYFTPKRIAL
jgi:hypothetical protein